MTILLVMMFFGMCPHAHKSNSTVILTLCVLFVYCVLLNGVSSYLFSV